MMLSKPKIKLIRSLAQKKYRRETGLFVAEGRKVVEELLAVFEPELIVALPAWLDAHATGGERVAVSPDELQRISLLQAPQEVLAVFRQSRKVSPHDSASPIAQRSELILALDGVQDPGNLGTILRTADWFGVEHLVCSLDTADVFNPKVVQASMGSLARVSVQYVNLSAWLKQLPAETPVYGTVLDGENLYATDLTAGGVVVMGNEGNGISAEVRALLTHKLLIPRFPADKQWPESLNVGTATALTLAAFRQSQLSSAGMMSVKK